MVQSCPIILKLCREQQFLICRLNSVYEHADRAFHAAAADSGNARSRSMIHCVNFLQPGFINGVLLVSAFYFVG